ncbi:hypothetical protein CDA63_13090 [Hymenobacter amundsenii]|uniref:Uncharacterized protein n=1 Tax=Hymenobacter amundsenii TaxID=2006685 RepID=A0A246FM71_9BACT|nr:hypothetical protein CDA63_13090 [Hymenobacter amundsenii]
MQPVSATISVTPIPTVTMVSATEADFNEWLQELMPGIRSALACQGFEKTRHLHAFQQYLYQRIEQPHAPRPT